MASHAEIKHTVPALGYGQPNFATCWHACYRAAFAFLKRTEASIDPALTSAGIDVPVAKQKGLLDTDFRKAAFALKLMPLFTGQFRETSIWPGLDPGAEKFLDELKACPLWVSRKTAGGGLHIVLAWGYSPDGDKVWYNNPFPGPDDALTKWMKANDFVSGISTAIGSVTRVQTQTDG